MGNYPENHDFGDEFPEFGSSLKPELARAALLTLTKQERVVLSHRCQGKLLKEIAQELKVSRKAIEYHLGKIYQKLRLDQKGWGYSERKYFLLKNYCPVLRELIKEINEEAITEISEPLGESPGEIIQLDPKIQAIIQMESEIEATMDEDKPVKIEIPPQPPIVIRTQTPPGRPRRRYGWIFLLVLLLAVGVGAFLLGQRFPYLFTPATPINNQQGGDALTPSTQAPGDTLRPTEVKQVIPTSSSEPPTDTPTATITPTITPIPTDTPTPTDTITPTPAPIVLFEDNFNTWPNPAWETPEGQTGELFGIGGTIAATNGWSWMYTGDEEWSNYKVTIKGRIAPPFNPSPHEPDIFAVRVVDFNNMVGLHVSGWGIYWAICDKGEWKEVPFERYKTDEREKVIVITVVGNDYRASVNGAALPPFSTDKFPNGRVGMFLTQVSEIDNFKVEEMP